MCYNMDEPWKFYAKWSKSDAKGHRLWFHLYNTSRIGKCTETERLEVGNRWEVGGWSDCLTSMGFLFRGDGNSLELDNIIFLWIY